MEAVVERNTNSFKRIGLILKHGFMVRAPYQPTLLLERKRAFNNNKYVFINMCVPLLLSPGSWYAQGFVCALQVCFPSPMEVL